MELRDQRERSEIEELMLQRKGQGSPVSVDDFMQLTLRNLIASMLDIRTLTQQGDQHGNDAPVCHLMACPRLDEFSSAVRHTIKVLHKTKGAFKSKELGALRHQLEAFMDSDDQTQQSEEGKSARPKKG